MHAIRIRPGIAIVVAAMCALAAAFVISSNWSADAASGASASSVVAVSPPERVLDTRDGNDVGLPGPFVSPVSQTLNLTGGTVPDGATGVLLNVTVVQPSAKGFVSIRPGDATGAPTTSSLNVVPGETVANSVSVGLADDGTINITYSADGESGPTAEILIDLVGYLTETQLADIDTRLDALEAAPAPTGPVVMSGSSAATSDADADDARDAAPEVALYGDADIEIYGKCFESTDDVEVSGEVFVRTLADGAVLSGEDLLPDEEGEDYLDTDTSEKRRQLMRVRVGEIDPGVTLEYADSESFPAHVITADGSYINVVASTTVKRAATPGGDGPLPAGDSCHFGVVVTR